MPTQRTLQLVDQSRFHVAVDVGDSQADHRLSIQSLTELLSQYSAMFLFHDEDDVCPTDMTLFHPDSRTRFCPC